VSATLFTRIDSAEREKLHCLLKNSVIKWPSSQSPIRQSLGGSWLDNLRDQKLRIVCALSQE
jgi:hypothetical protein